MYTPSSFVQADRETLFSLIREYSFGVLVTSESAALQVSHVPFLLDADAGDHGTLMGHLASANPHWRLFDGSRESTAIFQGPHGYISPAWYEEPLSVPTWNYAVVHAAGAPRVVEDPERVCRLLRSLTEEHERNGWSFDVLPEEYRDKMVRGIVAFEMPILRLNGKWKLSQNRPEPDQRRTISGLRENGNPGLADWMESALTERE